MKFATKLLLSATAVPVAGFGGLAMYVQYRQRTKPMRHIFTPVVDDNGNLLLQGKVIKRPGTFSILTRAIRLFFIFAPIAVLYIFMSLRGDWFHVWLEMLLKAVERAGPVFVKIGQWSCTREDIFSREFRTVFKRLFNEVDIHPFSDTLQILEEELETDPFNVFQTIEPTVVGSGSIGQVHLAKLRGSDRKVVIKVMHPHIIETIIRDFTILRAAAIVGDRLSSTLHRNGIAELIRAFASHLAAQLDFRIEAENLEQFRSNFAKEPYVEFPEPIMSTPRMLVESFCNGKPANPEFLASLPPYARDILATKGLNTWCQMLLRDNFIHGDMHPGNILIDATTDPHCPTVTLIDVGLCQQLTPEEGQVTHDLMESFVHWKPLLCADSLWRMGNQHDNERTPFEEDISSLFRSFRSNRNDEGAVTNILQAIFESVRKNHIVMDPPYVSLLFAVLVLESFIMNLDPNFNMVRHAAPWLVSEGHISKGVIKNLAKTRIDLLRQRYGVLTGHMNDSMQLENLEGNKNVRMSVNSF